MEDVQEDLKVEWTEGMLAMMHSNERMEDILDVTWSQVKGGRSVM